MPRVGKSAHKSDSRLDPRGSNEAMARRLRNALKKREKESARSLGAIHRELDALQAESQRRLSRLISRGCLRELNELRSKGGKLSRAQKERRALSALKACGVHPAQILELRLPFLKKARDILARSPSLAGMSVPHDEPCGGSYVTYVPPYGGWYWSYYWERTSNPRDPDIERYLDSATGRVGSRIRTSVAGADDDDSVYVEYHTGFNVWHTPQLTGPLEVQLTFDFTNAVLAGKVTDEIFWSDVTHVQFAEARMRATDSQDPGQFDDVLRYIDGVVGYAAGEDETWSMQVASPFETRSYRFRTAATFVQGSPVLLDAGVRHVTRWETNDESVSTNANIDLALTRIEVRSCEPDIFL